jgi:hypothetical protein
MLDPKATNMIEAVISTAYESYSTPLSRAMRGIYRWGLATAGMAARSPGKSHRWLLRPTKWVQARGRSQQCWVVSRQLSILRQRKPWVPPRTPDDVARPPRSAPDEPAQPSHRPDNRIQSELCKLYWEEVLVLQRRWSTSVARTAEAHEQVLLLIQDRVNLGRHKVIIGWIQATLLS